MIGLYWGLAWGGVAHFDALPEGLVGGEYLGEGMRIWGFADPKELAVFEIDDASGSLATLAGFTAPNVLATDAALVGPDVSMGRVLSISASSLAGRDIFFSRVDLFWDDQSSAETVSFIGWQDVAGVPVEVDRMEVVLTAVAAGDFGHATLEVSGPVLNWVELLGASVGTDHVGVAMDGWALLDDPLADTDGDGALDIDEVGLRTDPLDPADTPAAHTGLPQVHTGLPQVHTGLPQVHTGLPQVHTGLPQVHTGLPQVHTGLPQVHTGLPQVHTGLPPGDSDPPMDSGGPAHTGLPPLDTGSGSDSGLGSDTGGAATGSDRDGDGVPDAIDPYPDDPGGDGVVTRDLPTPGCAVGPGVPSGVAWGWILLGLRWTRRR